MNILIMFIFEIICSSIYFDYTFSIVELLLCSCMDSYSAHLLILGMGGRDDVIVVIRSYLPAFAPYMPGLFRVVDRGSDSTIESFAIHPPYVGLADVIIQVVLSFGLSLHGFCPHVWI
jgi:hypothetical protein